MDTTGIRTGVSGQEMPADFIQEVQVKSSGYNAEFRATTGGVISAITKTGSNVWRGGVGFYFRNNSFNGDPRAELRQLPTDASQAEYITRPDDEFSRTSRPSISAVRSWRTAPGSISAPRRISIAPSAP